MLLLKSFSKDFINKMISRIMALNEKIRSDKNLGDGFLIGHSFFCGNKKNKTEDEWFGDIVKYEIAPLLEEYWFDDMEKACNEIKHLLD
jgi:5-methylcytosine-specific restriction protein B